MRSMPRLASDVEVVGEVVADARLDAARGVTVATDAAVDPVRNRVGSGFIATSGLYGVAAHPQPRAIVGGDGITVAELRAVWRAVSALIESPDARAHVTILTDSASALGYLRRWKAGQEIYPGGYQLQVQRSSGNPSSLEQLAEQLRYDGDRYALLKVRGHVGHPLNEAADSLARLGLRSGSRRGVLAADVRDAAAAITAARLADYWNEIASGHQTAVGLATAAGRAR